MSRCGCTLHEYLRCAACRDIPNKRLKSPSVLEPCPLCLRRRLLLPAPDGRRVCIDCLHELKKEAHDLVPDRPATAHENQSKITHVTFLRN
jgi:hypothetical protein